MRRPRGMWVLALVSILVLLGVWAPTVVRADTPVFPVFDGYPKQGCYGYVVGSTGMWFGRGTITVDVPGPVVDAWLIWEGVNDIDDPGNPDTTVLEVNGQPVVGQMVDRSVYSSVHAPWYQWVADVGPSGYNLITQGPNTLDIFEWWPLDTYRDGSGSPDPRRNGVALMVIYDRGPCSDPVEIVPFYGSDYIWWQGDPALDGGPLTENHVFTFDPSPTDRQAHLVINFAGVSHTAPLAGICRDTAIWAAVGSGTPPSAIVQTGFPGSTGINGGVLVGDNLFNISPPCPQATAYPLVDYSGGFVGAEWSTTDLVFDIPAGNEWLAVQLESVASGNPPARPGGESGAWVGGIFLIPLPPPDVTVEKSDGLDTAEPGDVITYTLTFANVGPGLAQGVVITDTLPDRTTFVGCTTTLGTCTESGGVVVIDVGDLPAGDVGFAEITVQLDPIFPAGTTDLVNTAVISTRTDGDDPTNNTAEDVTTVIAFVEFTLTKADVPDPVDAGDPLTYTLTWEVGGNAFADNVVLTDTLPADATFVSASDGGTYDSASHTVTWNLGNLVPGDMGTVTLVVQTPAPAENGALLTNTAGITDASGAAAVVTETTTLRSFVEFTLTKADMPDPVDAGSLLTYTLTWEVGGNGFAHNVVLTDTLPADATFVSASDGGAYDSASHTVTWNLGELVPGDMGTVTLVVQAPGRVEDGTLLTNTAGITDASGAAAVVTETTTVRSADITGVVFEDANGNGTQDAGESGVAGAEVCLYTAGNLTTPVECATSASDGAFAFLNVPPGDYTLQLRGWPGGYEPTTPEQVTVTAPAGGTATAAFGIARPGLTVDKAFAVPPGTPVKVEVGDRITFTVRIENTGGLPLVTVPLEDTFDPAVLRFVSATPAPDSTTPAGTLTWNDLTGSGSLAPGDALEVTLVFEAVAEASSTTNTATVDGARTPGGQSLTESASLTFSVQAPTAVTLASILAEFDDQGAVILTWVTTAEYDNWGFNVYRAEVNDPAAAVRVNEHLIPSRGQAVSGATYRFVDTTVQPGKTYWYWIEDVDVNGRSTWHGPVEVYVPERLEPGAGGHATFLPLLWSW